MDKKKLRAYFMIFCASVLISIYLPSLIDLCSQRMVDGMVSETVETEAMTESGPGIAGTLPGADREETESGETRNDEGNDSRPGREESEMNPLHTAETDPASTAAEIQKKKEKQDAGLKKFRESFHPEITEEVQGVVSPGDYRSLFRSAGSIYRRPCGGVRPCDCRSYLPGLRESLQRNSGRT